MIHHYCSGSELNSKKNDRARQNKINKAGKEKLKQQKTKPIRRNMGKILYKAKKNFFRKSNFFHNSMIWTKYL